MDMAPIKLSVRKAGMDDYALIVDYFLSADAKFLKNMGADITKLPKRQEWLTLMEKEFDKKVEQQSFFYLIWLANKNPVGHSNINKIVFGEEAFMHLHIWSDDTRRKGIGQQLVKQSLPHYFTIFNLKNLYCEPYAYNPAPNKVLLKAGFDFVKKYETIPGWINFLQEVNQWCMSYEKFRSIYGRPG
ncbi:MAG: GNAT family N-acetyltransferase [Flavitalea sp.]